MNPLVSLFRMHPKKWPIGYRHALCGIVWELVARNYLDVPYWSKVVNGKVQKKQYTVPGLKDIERRLSRAV